MIEIIKGDILKSDKKYIVHQTNCTSQTGLGLAKTLFQEFPHANIYKTRQIDNRKDTPGTIIISGNEDRYIINLMGQYIPGQTTARETAAMREKWFQEGLDEMLTIKDPESFAFPYKIGCGLAGGDWNIYKEMIDEFAKKTEASVTIYQL